MGSAEALVFDAIRTPRGKGKFNGSLHGTKPVDLVVGLMHETLVRNETLDPNRIDDVVLGCVSPVGDQGADIAKTAAIKAGLPDTVAGVQLNRFCASGLEAVNIAAQKVASGWEDLVFAGGVESMSRVPMGSDGGAWAMDPETNYDTSFVPQGISADLIATIEEFSRDDVDAYAARSQERAVDRAGRGPLRELRDPGQGPQRPGRPGQRRVHPRRHDRRDARRPEAVVRRDGRDGRLRRRRAAEVPLGREDRPRPHPGQLVRHRRRRLAADDRQRGRPATRSGLTPRAKILATAVSGADPTIMLTGPAPASRKALEKAGITADQLDLVEINEAFAAVVLRFVRDMGLDMEKVNVNGGAIAMGHPLGATGGMILGTLIDELHRTGGRYGLATLCVGGGMGIATVVEAI